jgi:hypothetical protein
LRDAAAVFRAGETDLLADNPQERSVGLDLHLANAAVDVELCHALPLANCFDAHRTADRPGAPGASGLEQIQNVSQIVEKHSAFQATCLRRSRLNALVPGRAHDHAARASAFIVRDEASLEGNRPASRGRRH